MANIVFRLAGNALELATIITGIALSNPLSVLLVLSGTILLLFSFGFFGYLTVGALLSSVIPENIGRTPPQQGE